MPEPIPQKIERLYSQYKDYQEGASGTRYRSWEWCHQAFLKMKTNITKENKEEMKKLVYI